MLAALIVRAELGGAARTTRPEGLCALQAPPFSNVASNNTSPNHAAWGWRTCLCSPITYRHVVDESRTADAGGDQQAACALAKFIPLLQAACVCQFGIIN